MFVVATQPLRTPCRRLTDLLKQLQQAYLSFAAADFAVESCDYTHTSPTGLTFAVIRVVFLPKSCLAPVIAPFQ